MREPPYALEAEVAVLGAMLIDPSCITQVCEAVDEAMFYVKAHRLVFRAMTAIAASEGVVDPVSVSEHLNRSGSLDDAGGMVFLAELMDAVPTAANVDYHAGIVRERYALRRMIEVGTGIAKNAYDPGNRSTAELVNEAQVRVMELASDQGGGDDVVTLKSLLMPVFEDMESRVGKGGITGVPSGLSAVDQMTGGFQSGDLVLIAARPSMGKTAFVTGLALHAAIEKRVGVGFFSLEMSRKAVVMRMVCYEGLVNIAHAMRGTMDDSDFSRMAKAASHLNEAPLWITDRSNLTALEVSARARRLKRDNPDLGLVIVDYVQLMRGIGQDRNNEVADISKGLKALTKELDLPVLALSQLTRDVEKRADKRPQMSDLRDSGSLEQDADVVMFLYRPEYYMTPQDAQKEGVVGKAELIVSKQRNGPTGICELHFQKEYARFSSYTGGYNP